MLVSLDFQQAFDSVSKKSILTALESCKFGSYFINLIKTVINNTESAIQNGGWISYFFFNTDKGVRQGCCVSPMLFILVAEMLATRLRPDLLIPQVKIPEVILAVFFSLLYRTAGTFFICRTAPHLR